MQFYIKLNTAEGLMMSKNIKDYFVKGLILLIVGIVFSINAVADDELSYLEKAREKKYLGGSDESDLIVLPVLPVVKAVKIKTEEVEEGY